MGERNNAMRSYTSNLTPLNFHLGKSNQFVIKNVELNHTGANYNPAIMQWVVVVPCHQQNWLRPFWPEWNCTHREPPNTSSCMFYSTVYQEPKSWDAICVSVLTARQNAFQKTWIKHNFSLFTHHKRLFVKQSVSGSCVHYNLQPPAVLHRQLSSAAAHWHSFPEGTPRSENQEGRFVPLGGKLYL